MDPQDEFEGEEMESESDDPSAAEMEFAHSELLDEDDGDELHGEMDILKIISQCLKNSQRLRSRCPVNNLTQLTAVSEYVKF